MAIRELFTESTERGNSIFETQQPRDARAFDSDVWQNVSNVQIILMSQRLINHNARGSVTAVYIRQPRIQC